MDRPAWQPFSRIAIDIAATAPAIQARLDEHHRNDLAQAVAGLSSIGVSADHPLVRSVLPTRFLLSEMTTDVAIALESRRSTTVSASLAVGARVVTSFYEHRYQSTERTRGRIAITVVAAPASPRLPATEDTASTREGEITW